MKEIENWQYLSSLPAKQGGFFLSKGETLRPNGNYYSIFTYRNEELRRGFSIRYDKTTKEYAARVTVGLTEFCDITYIAGSLAKLEAILRERLAKTLSLLENFQESSLSGEFLQKKILEWPFNLPREIAGFGLFLQPSAPLALVNGSYIIIDYSDFVSCSSLIIYYNIFRDEFFGELKLKNTPLTTAAFDAKTLPELDKKIRDCLKPALESLRAKL